MYRVGSATGVSLSLSRVVRRVAGARPSFDSTAATRPARWGGGERDVMAKGAAQWNTFTF